MRVYLMAMTMPLMARSQGNVQDYRAPQMILEGQYANRQLLCCFVWRLRHWRNAPRTCRDTWEVYRAMRRESDIAMMSRESEDGGRTEGGKPDGVAAVIEASVGQRAGRRGSKTVGCGRRAPARPRVKRSQTRLCNVGSRPVYSHLCPRLSFFPSDFHIDGDDNSHSLVQGQMPRFLGLFSRKSKNAGPPPQPSTPSDDHSNVSISPTVSNSTGHDRSLRTSFSRSHRHADSTRSAHAPATPAQADRSSVYPSITSSPSAASTASSSKLRLPFSRKRQPPAAAASTTSVNTAASQTVAQRDCHPAPRPPFADQGRTSTASDGELTDSRRLRPPPSKSAIFAAYADPQGALSTRSLPNDAPQPFSLPDSGMPSPPSDCSPQPTPPPASPPRKSFFSWGRSPSPAPVAKTKSKSTPPSQPVQDPKADSGVEVSNSSFNLKSFRHVGPSSPLDSQASLSVPSPSPLPRPRGTSVGDPSQRISVAAFREAQARRSSMVDSPVPSLRSSSPLGTPPTPQEPGGRASPRLGPLKSSISHETNNRGLDFDSDADTSSSEEDSDGESDHERTLTQRDRWKGKAKAKSEMGHGILRSENMDMPSRSQSSVGKHPVRQRASMSTSAATPSAAAKKASILVNANDPSTGALPFLHECCV